MWTSADKPLNIYERFGATSKLAAGFITCPWDGRPQADAGKGNAGAPPRRAKPSAKPLAGKRKTRPVGPGFDKSEMLVGSGRQGLEPLGETRNLPRCGVLVQHALGGGAHQFRLRCLEGSLGRGLVAGGQRLFDLADEGADARAAVLVDRRAAGDLARCLFGRGVLAMVPLFVSSVVRALRVRRRGTKT